MRSFAALSDDLTIAVIKKLYLSLHPPFPFHFVSIAKRMEPGRNRLDGNEKSVSQLRPGPR